MLSEKQRTAIRLEEVYREEVRKSLTTPPTKRERMWVFFNSAFALWALSTIVVGLITWSYSSAQQRNESERESHRLARRLDLELADRLGRFRTHLASLERNGNVINISDLLRAMDHPQDQPYKMGVFFEFKEFSLRALLWQRVEVGDAAELKTAYDSAVSLEQIAAGLSLQTPEDQKASIVSRIRSVVDGPLKLDQWLEPSFARSGGSRGQF